VFAADHTQLIALDAATGTKLWHFETGQNINSAPITYTIDGRQFVTVAAGPLLLTFTLPVERPASVGPSLATATKVHPQATF
jgi:outer membrane protein assembly factor BamB